MYIKNSGWIPLNVIQNLNDVTCLSGYWYSVFIKKIRISFRKISHDILKIQKIFITGIGKSIYLPGA